MTTRAGKTRIIIVESCGDCPYCETDDWEFDKAGKTLVKLTLVCSELGKEVRNDKTIKRICPLRLAPDSLKDGEKE